jgi:hypothetical protein
MKKKDLIILLRYAAISGNILFILWVSFNAMDEGFQGTPAEKISGVGLIGLLAINCFLILNSKLPEQLINHRKLN